MGSSSILICSRGGDRSSVRAAGLTSFQGGLDFAFLGAAFEILSLVVVGLAACEGEFDLGEAAFVKIYL